MELICSYSREEVENIVADQRTGRPSLISGRELTCDMPIRDSSYKLSDICTIIVNYILPALFITILSPSVFEVRDLMKGATCGAENVYPSEVPDFPSVFIVSCPRSCYMCFHVCS